MNRTYLRGDMYYADLGRGIGSEQEGYRPVLILQNNTGNKYSPTVIVAAISSKVDAKAKLPTHYLLQAENGLELPSLVLLEQLRTIDKKRLGAYIGHLEEKHIRRINHALAVSVGLVEEVPENLIMCLCPACANNAPSMTGVQHMEIVFHTGKDSEQSLRQFAEKRAEFLTRELRDLNAEELKALLSTLKEDHRTFEQK